MKGRRCLRCHGCVSLRRRRRHVLSIEGPLEVSHGVGREGVSLYVTCEATALYGIRGSGYGATVTVRYEGFV